jgi:hypothetical protein
MNKIKFDLWKILEWGSWTIVNLLAFIISAILVEKTGNMWWWIFGFSILGFVLLYGETMRRKGKVDEEKIDEIIMGLESEKREDDGRKTKT